MLKAAPKFYNSPVKVKWSFPAINCYDSLKASEALDLLSRWQSPPGNPCLKWLTGTGEVGADYQAGKIKAVDRLYELIRANVKRGRVFDLVEVLREGVADCLGYAKLFTLLARRLGLEAGVIEVVIDNSGRYVPHTAALVRLSRQRWRCLDLWYGSKNIHHRRIGLRVKQGGTWQTADVDQPKPAGLEVSYLADSCINAITLYIRGNRHLSRQEFASAIRCYSKAIELYPGNAARFFYNRAVAYDNSGRPEKAAADYRQALSDESAVTRVLAREHNEVISLINLDAEGIDEPAQEMYLLHRGFATGKEVRLEFLARRFGLPKKETEAILSATEARLARGGIRQAPT